MKRTRSAPLKPSNDTAAAPPAPIVALVDEPAPIQVPAPLTLPLADGSSVRVQGDVAELRDREGRLLVRYANGSVEIAAPTGDLILAAPEGRVVVRSGQDIALEAERDLVQKAGRNVEIGAQRVSTTASVLVQRAERFELTATRLIEKTRDAFRDAVDLAQTRVGRARTIVEDAYALYARRTTMVSKEDTSIDGSKVLLG